MSNIKTITSIDTTNSTLSFAGALTGNGRGGLDNLTLSGALDLNLNPLLSSAPTGNAFDGDTSVLGVLTDPNLIYTVSIALYANIGGIVTEVATGTFNFTGAQVSQDGSATKEITANLTGTSMTVTAYNSFNLASIQGQTLTAQITNIEADSGSTIFQLSTNSEYYINSAPSTSPASSYGVTTLDSVCFARGTSVATPDGDQAVENLRAGDLVLTREGNVRPIKWIGSRALNLGATRRLSAPVRIKQGAFAENVPSRDLVLSPEHAVFVEGNLICARQLVNGASIVRETALDSVEYYHVELDSHDVLLTEGLATESYLDTGNRNWFANAEGPTLLRSNLTDDADEATREASSCAPFVTDGALVEPVWRNLADRAAAKGMTVPALLPEGPTTTDADLHVMIGNKRIDAIGHAEGRCVFMLPASVGQVRLVSRSVDLSHRTPWSEDRRIMGVRVNRLTLRHGSADVETIALDNPSLGRGWSIVEQSEGRAWRWTDGDATMRLSSDTPVVLEVEAETGLSYPLATAEATRAAA